MKRRTAKPPIGTLLHLIDEAYERKAWHGPNLRGSLRGVSAAEASRRPGPGRHNIHEIVVHAAYWKYAVRRRILGEKRGSFPMKGSNWFASPARLSPERWKADLALLASTHREMRSAILNLSPRELERRPPGSSVSNFRMIAGIALHDVYHAGQIQLLKRLIRR